MKNLLPKPLCIGVLCFAISHSLFSQQAKYALVIGAQNYSVIPPLRNSLNDAKSITATLQAKGFQVHALYDPKTKREMKDAVNWYYTQMQDKIGAVGLIYYAGHGMQYHGDNYIIPTTASLQSPGDLEDYCLKMNIVMEIINASTKSLNILLLDACRSLPSFTRGSEQGLSKMSPPEGSIIVFATTAGKVAEDGKGSNGLFTSKLLKALNEPGLTVNDVFRKVQRDVYTESGKQQLPELDDLAIGGDFYFTPGSGTTTTQPITQQKNEPAYLAPVTTALDYGYGTADAHTVTVGTQEWQGKNLNVDHFANGELIPEAKTVEEWKRASDKHTPAWCYYNNDPGNGRTYGRLYNWYAVNDPRGIAPKGWHVPSDLEWIAIIDYLGGAATAGTQLKSTSLWTNYLDASGNGNNKSSIACLPGGICNSGGIFEYMGRYGCLWSSTESLNGEAWYRFLNGSDAGALRYDDGKGCGLSVRCVKDY